MEKFLDRKTREHVRLLVGLASELQAILQVRSTNLCSRRDIPQDERESAAKISNLADVVSQSVATLFGEIKNVVPDIDPVPLFLDTYIKSNQAIKRKDNKIQSLETAASNASCRVMHALNIIRTYIRGDFEIVPCVDPESLIRGSEIILETVARDLDNINHYTGYIKEEDCDEIVTTGWYDQRPGVGLSGISEGERI